MRSRIHYRNNTDHSHRGIAMRRTRGPDVRQFAHRHRGLRKTTARTTSWQGAERAEVSLVRVAQWNEQASSEGPVAGSTPAAHMQKSNGAERGAALTAPFPLINTRGLAQVKTRKSSIASLIPTNQPCLGLTPDFSKGADHEPPPTPKTNPNHHRPYRRLFNSIA